MLCNITISVFLKNTNLNNFNHAPEIVRITLIINIFEFIGHSLLRFEDKWNHSMKLHRSITY